MAKDVAVYDFFGVKYQQTHLTIEQMADISDLFEEIDFEKMNALKLLSALVRNDTLSRFFNIILVGEKELDAKRLTPAQGLEVIEDFLSCNDIYGIISRIYSILAKAGQEISPEAFRAVVK